jgi:hypothetical protein
LRTRLDQARIRIPQGALDHVFLEQREPGLGLGRRDHLHPVAKCLARSHAALQLLHALVVTDARHLQPTNALVAAQLVVKVDAVLGGEDRHLVVHRVEAKIRRVCGRTYIGGDTGFVDAHDVVPPAFDQVVHHRGTHDATLANDDNFGSFREFGHWRLLLGKLDDVGGVCQNRAHPSRWSATGHSVFSPWGGEAPIATAVFAIASTQLQFYFLAGWNNEFTQQGLAPFRLRDFKHGWPFQLRSSVNPPTLAPDSG